MSHPSRVWLLLLYRRLLTTLPLAPDTPMDRECLHCGACRRICPGGCLTDGAYDYRLCKSYLTQKKEELTDTEKAVIARTPLIFGCDECQRVCPHNQDIPITPIPEFRQNRLTMLKKDDLEPLTNRQFRAAYGNRPFFLAGEKDSPAQSGYRTCQNGAVTTWKEPCCYSPVCVCQ